MRPVAYQGRRWRWVRSICGKEKRSAWIKTCSRLTLQTTNPIQAALKLNSGLRRQKLVHRQATCFWLIHSPERASPYINITQLAFSDVGEVGRCGAGQRKGTRGITWTCQQLGKAHQKLGSDGRKWFTAPNWTQGDKLLALWSVSRL
jgi:hypothetical protein